MGAPFLNVNPVEVILRNDDQRVNISLFDANNDPIDATALKLTVLEGSRTIYTETSTFGPFASARIVKPSGTVGEYYIDWGDPAAAVNIPNQTETNKIRDLFFQWRVVGASGTEQITMLQLVKIVDARSLAFVPALRLQVDKAVKVVDELRNCFAGYSDQQMVQFLEAGVNMINLYQPNTNMRLEDFPTTHASLLIDAATIYALQAQAIFAIDTDMDYNDQGYTFRIGHHGPIMQTIQFIMGRLDKLTPLFKLNFATMGSIHVEAGASYRMLQIAAAGGPGMLFRGFYATG